MDASRDTRFIIRNAGYKDVECVFKVRIPCAQQQTGQTPEGAAAPVDQLEKDHSLGPQTTASDDAHLDSSVGNSDSDDSFVCVAQQLTDTCTATTLSTPPNSTVHNADTQGQGRPTTSSAGTQAYNGRVDQQEAAHAPQHETITRVVQPGDVLDVLTAIQLISLQVIPCGTPIPGPALTDSSSPLPHQPHNTQPLPIRCIVVTYQRGVLEAHQAAGPGPVARWCMYDRGCLIDRRLQAVETCWALQGCWSSTGTYISELCHALLLPDPPCSPSIVATRLAALADAITTLGDLGGLQRYARCSITLLSSMQALHCKAVSDGDSALQGVVRHLASSVLGAGMAASLVTGVGNNAAAGRSSSGTQAGASTASLGTAAPATGGANVPAAAAASKPATLSAGKPASAAPVHASTACPAPPGSPPAPGAASAGIPSAAVPASKAAPTATGITASASASGLSATVLQAGPPKVQPGEDSQAPPVSGGAPIVITTLSELNQLLASLQVPKGDKAAQGWDVEVDLGGQTLCGSSGISITPATQQATQHLRHRWRPCLYCQWHPAAPGRGSHQSEPGGSPATEESHCHWHWGIIGPV